MNVEVSAADVDELQADDRGRVTLGVEYAHKTVTIAVVDIDE
jgi:hypothetical protein